MLILEKPLFLVADFAHRGSLKAAATQLRGEGEGCSDVTELPETARMVVVALTPCSGTNMCWGGVALLFTAAGCSFGSPTIFPCELITSAVPRVVILGIKTAAVKV